MDNRIAWHCISTTTGREPAVTSRLESRGIRTLFPRISVPVYPKYGKDYNRISALFPGYFFALASISEYQAAELAFWRNALRLVRFGGEASEVQPEIIEDLQARMDHAGIVRLPDQIAAGEQLSPGQRVRIVSAGGFDGYEGMYTGQTGADRVRVLMTVLGAPREVSFLRGDVRAISAA